MDSLRDAGACYPTKVGPSGSFAWKEGPPSQPPWDAVKECRLKQRHSSQRVEELKARFRGFKVFLPPPHNVLMSTAHHQHRRQSKHHLPSQAPNSLPEFLWGGPIVPLHGYLEFLPDLSFWLCNCLGLDCKYPSGHPGFTGLLLLLDSVLNFHRKVYGAPTWPRLLSTALTTQVENMVYLDSMPAGSLGTWFKLSRLLELKTLLTMVTARRSRQNLLRLWAPHIKRHFI